MKKILPFFILLLLAACVYVFFFWQPDTDSPLTVSSQSEGGEFTLQSLSGPVSLKDYRGKVTLLYFGYTMCPDVCPTNLSMMSNALMQLSDKELSQVQPIFISVDPKRDTMERLAEYSNYFHPSIIGASDTPEIIKELADRYGVAYQLVVQDASATNYVVDHSSETYVIDPQGKLVERLEHAAPPAEILAVIKKYSIN